MIKYGDETKNLLLGKASRSSVRSIKQCSVNSSRRTSYRHLHMPHRGTSWIIQRDMKYPWSWGWDDNAAEYGTALALRRRIELLSRCVRFGSTFFHLASALRPMFMSAGPVVLFEWHLLGIWPLVYFILYCSSLEKMIDLFNIAVFLISQRQISIQFFLFWDDKRAFVFRR